MNFEISLQYLQFCPDVTEMLLTGMLNLKTNKTKCFSVALNYQTPGLMMDLYNGWFNKNGGCGYVLKSAIMPRIWAAPLENFYFTYAKNKDADQMCSNCTADQRLCFCYLPRAIPVLVQYDISSILSFFCDRQVVCLGQKPQRPVFLRCGSYNNQMMTLLTKRKKQQQLCSIYSGIELPDSWVNDGPV